MNNETIMNSGLVSTEELWRLKRVDFHTLHMSYTEVGSVGFPFWLHPICPRIFFKKCCVRLVKRFLVTVWLQGD